MGRISAAALRAPLLVAALGCLLAAAGLRAYAVLDIEAYPNPLAPMIELIAQPQGLIVVKHGSGATVSSRTVGARSDTELRRPLRTALTQLVLAGLPKRKILGMVSDELQALMKGAR